MEYNFVSATTSLSFSLFRWNNNIFSPSSLMVSDFNKIFEIRDEWLPPPVFAIYSVASHMDTKKILLALYFATKLAF